MPSFERHAAFRISQQCISTKLLELRNVMERSWIETRTATNRVLPRIQINKADMIMMSGLWACDVAHAPTQPINHARLEKKIRMFWKSCIEIPVCCQLFQLNPEKCYTSWEIFVRASRSILKWNKRRSACDPPYSCWTCTRKCLRDTCSWSAMPSTVLTSKQNSYLLAMSI